MCSLAPPSRGSDSEEALWRSSVWVVEGLTICDIRAMLLLLLHMKPTSASHASCRSIRIPVNRGARFAKFASAADQFS